MENAAITPIPLSEPVPLRHLVQDVLRFVAESASASENIRVHAVFDCDRDHYLLVTEGWQGYRRIYRTLAHVALNEGCLHVYEDGTVEGIAERLQAGGVPKEKIVCEWVVVPGISSSTLRG